MDTLAASRVVEANWRRRRRQASNGSRSLSAILLGASLHEIGVLLAAFAVCWVLLMHSLYFVESGAAIPRISAIHDWPSTNQRRVR